MVIKELITRILVLHCMFHSTCFVSVSCDMKYLTLPVHCLLGSSCHSVYYDNAVKIHAIYDFMTSLLHESQASVTALN